MSDRRTDRVFKVLADKSRRRMLDLLAQGPQTTGQLAAQFSGLSRFAVMKHLRQLELAGLLIVSRQGRVRWNSLNAVPLQEVLRRWVGKHEQLWADVMLNIRDDVEVPGNQRKNKGAKS